MVMFLALHPMEFIFLNSSDLLEHQAMLLTSTIAINCLLKLNLFKQGYRYHKLCKSFFLNCIADTMILYLNSMLDLNLSWARVFRNLSFKAN